MFPLDFPFVDVRCIQERNSFIQTVLHLVEAGPVSAAVANLIPSLSISIIGEFQIELLFPNVLNLVTI